jgi:hypothetical protein
MTKTRFISAAQSAEAGIRTNRCCSERSWRESHEYVVRCALHGLEYATHSALIVDLGAGRCRLARQETPAPWDDEQVLVTMFLTPGLLILRSTKSSPPGAASRRGAGACCVRS